MLRQNATTYSINQIGSLGKRPQTAPGEETSANE